MASPLMRPQRRTSKKTSNKEANKPQPATPIYIASASVSGSVLTVTFDQPVMLDGKPQLVTNLGGAVVSASKTGSNVVAITYDQSIAGAESITISFQDPAIRNSSGGFVTANVVVI